MFNVYCNYATVMHVRFSSIDAIFLFFFSPKVFLQVFAQYNKPQSRFISIFMGAGASAVKRYQCHAHIISLQGAEINSVNTGVNNC